MSESKDPWEYYRLQADRSRFGAMNAFFYAREEILEETLKKIEKGGQFTSADAAMLDRMLWNRAKKHRRLSDHRRVVLRGRPHRHLLDGRQPLAASVAECGTCGHLVSLADMSTYGGCESCWVDATESAEKVDNTDFASWVKGQMDSESWGVERRLADGETYREIACSFGITEGALKVRVSRWRAEIRRAS
jgi:hypothetical protein